MDNKALFNITYGLYLLTTRELGRDNGCVINSVMQVANDPVRIAVSVQKNNKTHDMIKVSGMLCVSTITQSADFSLFGHFGMQSGRDTDKFANFSDVERTGSTLYRLNKHSNAYFVATVDSEQDLGTHTLFIATVFESEVTGDEAPCTYSYYQSDIKPKPQKSEKKQWVCSVCGYVYEGDELPEDYVCPLCRHPREVFEPAEK